MACGGEGEGTFADIEKILKEIEEFGLLRQKYLNQYEGRNKCIKIK